MIRAATNMVTIRGIVESLVTKPASINNEQSTSAKIAILKDNSGVMPNTLGNLSPAPEKNIINFGIPCVNIKAEMPTLVISNPISVNLESLFTLNTLFILIGVSIFYRFNGTKLISPSQPGVALTQ